MVLLDLFILKHNTRWVATDLGTERI